MKIIVYGYRVSAINIVFESKTFENPLVFSISEYLKFKCEICLKISQLLKCKFEIDLDYCEVESA